MLKLGHEFGGSDILKTGFICADAIESGDVGPLNLLLFFITFTSRSNLSVFYSFLRKIVSSCLKNMKWTPFAFQKTVVLPQGQYVNVPFLLDL